MMRNPRGLILLVLLVIFPIAARPAPPSATELLLNKARSLEARGRMDLAVQSWQEVLTIDPDQPEALAGMARMAKANHKDEEARRYLEHLRRVSPHDPAIAQIENMVAASRIQSRLAQGAKLAQDHQYEKAMEIYREMFRDQPPPGEWAVAYYETDASTAGGWERATAGLRELLKRYPDSEAYRLSLGKLLTYRGATRMAGIDMLRDVKGSAVFERDARLAWRQALIWEKGSGASAESLREYLGRFPDPELQGLLATAEKQRAVKKETPAAPDLRVAYTALQASRLAEAEAKFQAIVKRYPNNAGALAGLGYVRMKNQDFAGALRNFEAARTQMSGNKDLQEAIETSRFWLNTQDATKALKEQRTGDAVNLFQKALAIRPSDATALEGFAGALMQQGNLAAATPVLERLVRVNPDNIEAWRTLIEATYRKTGAQTALAKLKLVPAPVSAKLAQQLEYQILIASVYRDAGEEADAKQAFRQALLLAKNAGELSGGTQLELAGLYLEYGDPVDASVAYQRLIDNKPDNLDAWEGLVLALHKAKDDQRALRTLEDLPQSVRSLALQRPGFLRAVANVELAIGKPGSAEGLLQRALDLEKAGGAIPSFYTQLQLAQVWLDQGQRDKATAMFTELTRTYPDNPDGWKGLMLAMHRDQRDADALDISHRIPAETNQRLQDDPDYLSLLGSLYSANGQAEEALPIIRRAMGRYQAAGAAVPVDITIQFAWLLLGTEGNQRELFSLLRDARARTDLTVDARKTLNEILVTWVLRSAQAARESHDNERTIEVLESALRVLPGEQRIRRALAADLLASGDTRRALGLYKAAGLRNAMAADYVAAVGTALAERETQLANTWLTEGLNRFPLDPDLLNTAGKQAAAKGDFRKAELYWREAMHALQLSPRAEPSAASRRGGTGGSDDAINKLGAQLLGEPEFVPSTNDRRQPAAAGSDDRLPWLLGPTGPSREAHPVPPSGPRTPVWKAPAPKNPLVPQTSTDQQDIPALLHEVSNSIGEPARPAESLLAFAREPRREANSQVAPDIPPASAEPAPSVEPAPTPARLVTNDSQSTAIRDLHRYLKKGVLLDGGDLTASVGGGQEPLSQATPETSPPQSNFLKNLPPAVQPAPTSGMATGDQVSKEDQIENQLKAVEGRNSPTLGLGGFFQDRSGQAGFDKMSLQESDLEASTIVDNRIRLGLVARAIQVNTPAADGSSTLRFGMLPAGDAFASQSVSGLGADAQLATTNFGMHFGATPRGFLVRNLLGGFRFRPAGGPITIQFDRDDLRDSMLSYVGARDPLSHTVWGGVVSNVASLSGNWGNEKSGAYFSTSFHEITGKNVATNQRIDGTVGVYWRLVSLPVGSLTAGVNLFAMHYAKNLRYFTLGQGGYFSPQRFVLFGVPVNWTGSWKHLQYVASMALGSQSFSEDSSPYFPTAPAAQSAAGPFYPQYSNSGTNYNVDFRLAYQLSPNWYVAGYFNANNARFYTLQTIGVTVRYSLQPRPLDSGLNVPAVPDWRGKQIFGLP